MSLNLKPILSAQADNEKLDTINYNFDQIVANGGGPMGAQGATGPQGLDGLTGPQGNQGVIGNQGNQGPQGAAAANYWKINANIGVSNKTLVPVHGTETNPPTLMIGVDKLDPLYETVFNETAILINRKAAYGYNLVLTDDSVTTSDNNNIGFKLFQDGTTTKFEMGFANTSNANPTQWQFYADSFEFSDGTNNFVEILNTGFNVNVNATFSQPTTFQNTVKINSGNPADGKILVATDIQGTTSWKSVSEIGGVVPVGTIVPILTSIFDNTANFYKDSETWAGGSGQVLKVRHGRGTGSYKGWYLCNGKTWTNGLGLSRQVPDLNSFDYVIDAFAGSAQGAASGSNTKYAVIGGANVAFHADYVSSPASYAFDDTITTTTQTIFTTATTTTPYDLVHLVFVVYLGEDGLYWQDNGITAVNHSYLALRSKTTSSLASNVNYTISGSGTFTTSAAPGSSGVTITYTLTPASGYQFNSTANVALYTSNVPWTNAQGGWGAYDPSVTQTSATINQSGQLVLTLTDSSFPTTNNLYSWLYLIGDAVQIQTGTGISVKRSTTGFQGNNNSAWSDTTVYLTAGSTFNTATVLYSNSGLSSGASTGWYAYYNGTSWSYRYYSTGAFSSMYNISGVNTAPGSWSSVSSDSLITNGSIGNFPVTANNACTSIIQPIDVATYFWSNISTLSTMASGNTAVVVASGNTAGNGAPINWNTHSTYGSGYVSLYPCYKLWSFTISTGLLTRTSVSCASIDPSYDTGEGIGDCTSSGGSGGGAGGSSY